jgi:hypothetical protein
MNGSLRRKAATRTLLTLATIAMTTATMTTTNSVAFTLRREVIQRTIPTMTTINAASQLALPLLPPQDNEDQDQTIPATKKARYQLPLLFALTPTETTTTVDSNTAASHDDTVALLPAAAAAAGGCYHYFQHVAPQGSG